jgi:hypothetical protein
MTFRGCGGAGKGDGRIMVQCFILTDTHISRTYCIALIEYLEMCNVY